jgi:hypothetical protein
VARNLEISGFKVDVVDNREGEIEESKLSGKKADLESVSGRWLTDYFDCQNEINPNQNDGQLELILGSKYKQKLAGGD